MKFSLHSVTVAMIGMTMMMSAMMLTTTNNSAVSAFAPMKKSLLSTSTSSTTFLCAAPNIWSTMGSLEGPSVCWGPEGVIIGHAEIEVKEYDNFSMFRAALEQCGLANELRGLGPYTLLLPTDSAVCAYEGVLDEDVLRYHILKGDLYSDELLGPLETLNPHYTITATQQFRKAYVDDCKYTYVFVCLCLCLSGKETETYRLTLASHHHHHHHFHIAASH